MMYIQKDWESDLKEMMEATGWQCDRDDETHIGFSYHQGEFHWIRDYCKKRRRFVQYNGNQVVSLISTKTQETTE